MNISAISQDIVSPRPVVGRTENQRENYNVIQSFGDAFKKALGEVNDLQLQSDGLVQKMITEPSKVNIHDVTMLLSQAEMSLAFTKAVTDRVINAYREITNLR